MTVNQIIYVFLKWYFFKLGQLGPYMELRNVTSFAFPQAQVAKYPSNANQSIQTLIGKNEHIKAI